QCRDAPSSRLFDRRHRQYARRWLERHDLRAEPGQWGMGTDPRHLRRRAAEEQKCSDYTSQYYGNMTSFRFMRLKDDGEAGTAVFLMNLSDRGDCACFGSW